MTDVDPANVLVVGFDESPETRAAVAAAIRLAIDLDAELVVVHVADLRDYPIDPDQSDWEERGDERLAEIRQHAAAMLDGSSVRWTYQQRRGDPAQQIAAAAHEHGARMIVVGTHAASGVGRLIEHMLRGARSVPHALEHDHVPVLVVPSSRPPHGTPSG